MADLRIVDAPLLSTVKGTEKIPTGGEGNFSVSVNQVADFAKLKWFLATEEYVDNAVGNVQADLNLHKNNSSNPHGVTKVQVGLGNVDNTADLDKPVSNATQSAIITANSGKADKSYVDSQDQLKADKNTVEASLLLKADKIDLKASKISSDGGQNQQEINDFGGAKWYAKVGGYKLGATVKLENGDIVKSTIPNNTNDPNVDMTGWELDTIKNAVTTVATIADMLAITNAKDGTCVYVESFRGGWAVENPYIGSKGGDHFLFVSSRSSENDGISIFDGWARLNIKEVTPEMAGAYANFVTDDEIPIVKAQELARKLKVPLKLTGRYAKSKPFVCLSWDVVEGTSNRQTRIRKIGTFTSGLAARQAPEKAVGVMDDYDVDACLIFYPWDNAYATNIKFKDVYFDHGEWGVDPTSGYGFYAPRHAVCNTENLDFTNVVVAFYTKVFWNNSHKRFGSVSGVNLDNSKSGDTAMVVYDGEGQYTGTSNICEHFLFNNFKRGYDIQNLQTSTFTACYGENISDANGVNETQTFRFVNPHDITLNGCGQESSYGTPLYILAQSGVPNCSIVLNGFQAVWGTNGTTTEKLINMLTIDGPVTVTSNGSNFKKGNEGFLFDGFYLGSESTLINNGSSFGASSFKQAGSKYIDVSTAITEKDGVVQSTKDIGADINNGWENKVGMSVKAVNGATLNIPAGLTDAWGISVYYGANTTQGVQLLMSTVADKVYKRRRTGADTSTAWTEM